MRDFKFFEKGTLDMMDGETYATASFADTPEGHMNRRYSFHTNPLEYNRQREQNMLLREESAQQNEDEEFVLDPILRQNQEPNIDRIRNILSLYEQQDQEEITNFFRFFNGGSRVTRLNPKWWMKVKMFFQKLSLYSDQIFPITIFSILITVIVSAIIAKILNI